MIDAQTGEAILAAAVALRKLRKPGVTLGIWVTGEDEDLTIHILRRTAAAPTIGMEYDFSIDELRNTADPGRYIGNVLEKMLGLGREPLPLP